MCSQTISFAGLAGYGVGNHSHSPWPSLLLLFLLVFLFLPITCRLTQDRMIEKILVKVEGLRSCPCTDCWVSFPLNPTLLRLHALCHEARFPTLEDIARFRVGNRRVVNGGYSNQTSHPGLQNLLKSHSLRTLSCPFRFDEIIIEHVRVPAEAAIRSFDC